MSTLWFQSCYTDTEGRHRFLSDYQGPRDRVGIVIDDHHAALTSMLYTYLQDPHAQLPGYTIPEEAAPPAKVSTYIGTDGIRHTTFTTQGDGESEANWQARHDAAHAALQAIFPPAP